MMEFSFGDRLGSAASRILQRFASARCGAALLLVALSSLLVLPSCGRHDEGEGKIVFRYNEAAGIGSLDPAFAKDQARIWACTQLYGGLVRLDEHLRVEPCLAKSWEISRDGCLYTFHLRTDALFHRDTVFCHSALALAQGLAGDSTRRMVAQDFVYSLRRILDDKVASPGRWVLDAVADNGFIALDDSTFSIRLKEPFAPFLGLLSMPYCAVVPKEAVEAYGEDFGRHPCGTGPFHLQLWSEDVKLVMRRNDRYFEFDSAGVRLPYVDGVAVTFIKDKQTAFLEFVKGNLDFLNSIDASYKDELLTSTGQLREKYKDRIVMERMPFLNTEYLGFKMETDSPLADKRVRMAVNYGFDRVKMMRYLRNGIGIPGVGGLIPAGLEGSCVNPQGEKAGGYGYGYGYDPDKARSLLAEAGFPDGKGLGELVLTTTSGYMDLCRYIQQQLGLIGIQVKVDVMPPAALREEMAECRCDWFRGSWIADYPDAENYLSLLFSGNFAPEGPNYTHFSNPQYDRLYRRAKGLENESARVKLYRQMDSIAMCEAPLVVLYYDQAVHFYRHGVHGIRSNAMNALDLRELRIEKEK